MLRPFNSVFRQNQGSFYCVLRQIRFQGGYKKGPGTLAKRILGLVPGPGIEPGWVAPPVFETGASTDSAIRAL